MHFVYTAMNSNGQEEAGLIPAVDISSAKLELEEKGFFPTSVVHVKVNLDPKKGDVFNDSLSCKFESDGVSSAGLLNIRTNDSGDYEIVFMDQDDWAEKVLPFDAVNVELEMGFIKTTLVISAPNEKWEMQSLLRSNLATFKAVYDFIMSQLEQEKATGEMPEIIRVVTEINKKSDKMAGEFLEKMIEGKCSSDEIENSMVDDSSEYRENLKNLEEILKESSQEEVLQAFNKVDKDLQTFFYDAMISDYGRWAGFLKKEFEHLFHDAVNSKEFGKFGFDDFDLVCDEVPSFWQKIYPVIKETMRNGDTETRMFCLELLDFLTPDKSIPDIVKEIEPMCDSPVRKVRYKARKVFNNYVEDESQFKKISFLDKCVNFFSVFFGGKNIL